VLGHQVIESGSGTLCTTLALRAALVDGSRAAVALGPRHRRAAEAFLIPWDGDALGVDAGASAGFGDAGLIDTARDSIKPSELDALGRAAPAAFIHRFSAANAQLLAGFGLTPAYMRDERRGFSTFEFRLRFPGALSAGDLVVVRSGLLHVGNSSVRIAHRMTRSRTGEEVATLEQAGVLLDVAARRPAPIPDELRARAKSLLVGEGSRR
jgi:acyl-CoA thioester hydrolase